MHAGGRRRALRGHLHVRRGVRALGIDPRGDGRVGGGGGRRVFFFRSPFPFSFACSRNTLALRLEISRRGDALVVVVVVVFNAHGFLRDRRVFEEPRGGIREHPLLEPHGSVVLERANCRLGDVLGVRVFLQRPQRLLRLQIRRQLPALLEHPELVGRQMVSHGLQHARGLPLSYILPSVVVVGDREENVRLGQTGANPLPRGFAEHLHDLLAPRLFQVLDLPRPAIRLTCGRTLARAPRGHAADTLEVRGAVGRNQG